MYSGLQVPSERSSMEGRALDYIEDIMKYIKPSLVSKNQEGHQLVYWAVGRWKHFHTSLCNLVIKEFPVNECGCFWTGCRLHSEALEPPAGHSERPAAALWHCGWSAASPQYPPAGQSAEGQPASLSAGEITHLITGTMRFYAS